MRLKIKHTTRYHFDEPVKHGLMQLRKTPMSCNVQSVLNWSTQIDGGTKEVEYLDYHGNRVELISYGGEDCTLTIQSEGEVEVAETHGVVGAHFGLAPLWLFRRPTDRTKPGPGLRELVRSVAAGSDLDRMHGLMAVIADAVDYEKGASTSDWTAEEAVQAGKGVCQDHAHIFVTCARLMGLPARYVSGFLMMPETSQQDATHAWAEAHIDGLGWVGFDVSNRQSPDERYVRVATGLDYSQAAPVTGTRLGGGDESLSVALEVAQQYQQ